MKKIILYFLPLTFTAMSCARNEATGEMEPKWVFWVMLGLIAFLLIFGAFVRVRGKKDSGEEEPEEKSMQQIENYEETLRHKEEENDNDKTSSEN